MHEYSLVEAMFDQIRGVMRARGAVAVRRVRVRLGDFSGVDPALFRTAYEIFRVATPCADAPLDIEEAGACDDLILEQVELEVP
jgi:hydrogenase nickel incorporation protein HypA/HybF